MKVILIIGIIIVTGTGTTITMVVDRITGSSIDKMGAAMVGIAAAGTADTINIEGR